MQTTKPVPQKGKLARIFCDVFIGHTYSINQILTAEEEESYPWRNYHRFCEKCGHGEFRELGNCTFCEAFTCEECPRQKLCIDNEGKKK